MNISARQVLLAASEVELHIGDFLLLNKISFSIQQGEKIGLVGRNGSGKTSLLKTLIGIETIDGGRIEKKRDLTIGYLSQEFTLDLEKTVYENLMSGAHDIVSLIREYESLPTDSERKHELFEEINYLDGWNLDIRINKLISTMNLPSKDSQIKNFSGGEKRRLSLAKAIVGNPDLLILDEPTNHLDTENIEWLEGFLQKYKGAVLFITHDRYFLDRIASRIIELSNGHLHSYSGNYTDFLIKKAERAESEERYENNRQKFLQKELAWIERSPQGRTTKSKGRIQRFEQLAAQEKKMAEVDVEMIIPTPPKLSDRILDLKNVGYEIEGRKLFSNVNINFRKGMRVGVVGKNGAGKSTLIKTIIEELPPTEGLVDIASRTEINYSDQEKLVLNPDHTVVQEISDSVDTVFIGGKTLHPKAYLKRFLFNERQLNSKIKNLSGGEKSRLILAKILKNGGNFLILDEPTNDLDLSTLRVLEEALINFEGCVLLVSHDRYFLNRVCTHILGFEDDGKTRLVGGDYDFYKKIISDQALATSDLGLVTRKNDSVDNATTLPHSHTSILGHAKFDYEKQKEIKRIERQIQQAEESIKRQEARFGEPDFYEKNSDKISEFGRKLRFEQEKVKELYEKWEELLD